MACNCTCPRTLLASLSPPLSLPQSLFSSHTGLLGVPGMSQAHQANSYLKALEPLHLLVSALCSQLGLRARGLPSPPCGTAQFVKLPHSRVAGSQGRVSQERGDESHTLLKARVCKRAQCHFYPILLVPDQIQGAKIYTPTLCRSNVK